MQTTHRTGNTPTTHRPEGYISRHVARLTVKTQIKTRFPLGTPTLMGAWQVFGIWLTKGCRAAVRRSCMWSGTLCSTVNLDRHENQRPGKQARGEGTPPATETYVAAVNNGEPMTIKPATLI